MLTILVSSLCGFNINTCTVPLSLEHARKRESPLKLKLNISAFSAPRRSSCSKCPLNVLNTRKTVPLSDAVHNNVPSLLRDTQPINDSCAVINWECCSSLFGVRDLTRTHPFF